MPLALTIGSGPISLVQSGPIVATNGAAGSATLPIASTPGSTLILVIGNASSGQISALPAGWNFQESQGPVSGSEIEIWAYANHPGGLLAVTFVGTAVASPWYAQLSEWANVGSVRVGGYFNLVQDGNYLSASATSGTTLTLTENALPAQNGELTILGWIQLLAAPSTVTFSSPAGFTRLADNGSQSLAAHLAIEYQINPSTSVAAAATVASTGTTSSAVGAAMMVRASRTAQIYTDQIRHGSQAVKKNTYDFSLVLGETRLALEDGSGLYVLEDGSGYFLIDQLVPSLGDPVTLGGPSWSGRAVSVNQSDLVDRVTNKQLVHITATNQAADLGGIAPGDLADVPVGGFLQLEDGSGDLLLEDGNGHYVLEGTSFAYRNLTYRQIQNVDGTSQIYGSLETFEGGFAAGQSVTVYSTNFGFQFGAVAGTITNVTASFVGANPPTPVYLVEFGDAYQTLQKAGGGVLTQQGSQANIQAGVAVPAGVLGSATIATTSQNFTTEADVAGLSVTVPVAAGRRIRVSFTGRVESSVVNDRIGLFIADENNNHLASGQLTINDIGAAPSLAFDAELVPGAGVHTYKIRGIRNLGSGNCNIFSGAGSLAKITVEDIGT